MRINAHRGDSLRYRENTMPAFASAIALGADCIELDIHSSKDGCPVVLHDPSLHRLWGIDRAVAHLDYAEILTLTRRGAGDLYVPHLEEVLREFDVPVMVDFTEDSAVTPIARALKEQGAIERCVVSSRNIAALAHLREKLPGVAIALTWDDIVPPSEVLLDQLDVQYFNPNYRIYDDSFVTLMSRYPLHRPTIGQAGIDSFMEDLLRRRREHPAYYAHDNLCGAHMVERMHRSGRKVSAWTVDDPAVMREMLGLGVDLITTNEIRTLKQVRGEFISPPGQPRLQEK